MLISLSLPVNSILAQSQPCAYCELTILDGFSEANVSELRDISERNKERVDLAVAKVTYGFLGIGVGRPVFYLNIKDNKIVDFNLEGEVGVLGINRNFSRRITIDQLKAGVPLEFSVGDSPRAALRIRPSENFDEYGGQVTIEVWNGRGYDSEVAHISAVSGRFRVYKDRVASENEVTGLDINVRGMSIPNIYVHSYRIRTR